MIISLPGGVELDDDSRRVDLDTLWDLLQREAYWGRFRSRDVVERQVADSWRVLGAYRNGQMIGFARAVADGEALAYLADVIVEPAHRGQGLGMALARELVESEPAAGWRWMLHTRDAHTLYARLGFRPPDGTYLERPRPAPSGAASGTPDESGLVLVASFDIPADGVEAFQAYEAEVLPLLRDHGGRLERRLRGSAGTYEVHVLRFRNAAGLEAYRNDPVRAAAAHRLIHSGPTTRVELVEDI